MRRLALVLGLGLLVTACGDASDATTTDAGADQANDLGGGSDGVVDDRPTGDGGGDLGTVDDRPGGDGGGDGAMGVDTWATFGSAFFASYCNKCHSADGSGVRGGVLDFTQFDKVKGAAAKIRCGTAPTKQAGCGASPAPRQFPIGTGPKPSDDERTRLVAWIDGGLAE